MLPSIKKYELCSAKEKIKNIHVIPSGNGTKNKKGKKIILCMSICRAIAT
tara:strand:- start:168 stop:317 length:150 start_codon:yes stop_codon:yes gene_type:complete